METGTRPPAQSRLVSVPDASRWLGISKTKTYELIMTGQLGSVRVGRRRLVPSAAIDEFIAQLQAEAV